MQKKKEDEEKKSRKVREELKLGQLEFKRIIREAKTDQLDLNSIKKWKKGDNLEAIINANNGDAKILRTRNRTPVQ